MGHVGEELPLLQVREPVIAASRLARNGLRHHDSKSLLHLQAYTQGTEMSPYDRPVSAG
jgi:hypothetical protein